ncbi:MAG: SURF1 family protein [Nocardioidaceae bacterium]|nr:SURF1 family protein [Nocardioidaceae bacterium]
MSRYLTLRALGLAVVAVVLMAAMVVLGLWQLGTYDDQQRTAAKTQLTRDPVPLDKVVGPDDPFPADGVGRPVTVSGVYLAAEQLYVDGFGGADARYAVVTPLLTESGSAVLVVRGSAHQPAADVPQGEVRVTGVLEPATSEGAPLDADRVTDGLRISALVSEVSVDLYGGYVVATTAASTGLEPVTPDPPAPSRWAGLRNLLYAVQWWLFAAFVAFMWWRAVNDETATGVRDQVG